MKILVIGGGGREHAVVKALKRSKYRPQLFCAPGNAGIAEDATLVDLSAVDLDGITAFAVREGIDLVFVTPDDPLSLGLVDRLSAVGVRAFGPNKAAARLEASKSFAKSFMKRHQVPTAAYEVFDDAAAAENYVKTAGFPVVIKADGLALGKGVIVPESEAEAVSAIREMMVDGKFGKSGSRVVIEERLYGREVTVLCFCDGKTIVPMPASQDHKRAYDGDKGLNTGGMGAFAPTPYFTDELKTEFTEKIAKRTLDGLAADGIDYRGVVYFGLMITKDGLRVIEYNVRLGDPETQVVMPLLKSDLPDIMNAVIDGKLADASVEFDGGAAVTVVVACKSYPESSDKGLPIEIGALNKTELFHAGTANKDGRLVTNGGRVFALTALADTIEAARQKVYAEIDKVAFSGARYRTDIGKN